MSHTITVDFSGGANPAIDKAAWQYDYGANLAIKGLDLPANVEIHFATTEYGGKAETRMGTTEDGVTTVAIPDRLLEMPGRQDYRIYAYIYLTDGDSGHTEYKICIRVHARPKPEDEIPDDGKDHPLSSVVQELNRLDKEKLNYPVSPVAGQLLRVKAINDDGTIVLETVAGGGGGGISDVQVDGTSVVDEGVAKIPIASKTAYGAVKLAGQGVMIDGGSLYTERATKPMIDSRNYYYQPIAPAELDYAVKVAMSDGKGEAWTETEQIAARERLSCYGKDAVDALKEDIGDIATVGENLFNYNGTRHLNSRIDDFGNIAAGSDIVYELPVDGGGTYVSNMPTIGAYKISCISKDGVATIVTPSTTSDFEEHFTLPDGTVKAYMSFWSGRDSEVESVNYAIFKKGMIVSGNTLPSEYIPYYKNLNEDIKVNESNIKDGTNLNEYIDTEALRKEVSNVLFDEALNLIDSGAYLRGTLSPSGVVVESTDDTANYIYTVKIRDGIFIGMNAVPQNICFYDENMEFLEYKQFADTPDDTVSVRIPGKGKYAKLSYWYGRGVDGAFEHVTHLKNISVVIDSIPFSAIKKDPTLDSTKKITRDNLCDGFELNSKLAKGIKWYILGDSRSVDLAYTTKFYHDYLCEKHKFVRKKNLAVSGARIRSADTAYHSLLEQYPSVGEDADLITIYAGINDYGQDNPTEIGTEGSTDLTTFYGAFESLITNLITNHPTAKIVVITPIPQYNFEINNTIVWGDRNDTNALGTSLDDYCNAIKKICRKYGVFVKDACYESGITPRIASQRSEYFKDGLHHNEKGQLVLANYLSDIFDLLDC